MSSNSKLTQFLGSWYGIFPFKLADLAGRVKADMNEDTRATRHIEVPPFTLLTQEQEEYRAAAQTTREALVTSFNEAVTEREQSLALESSQPSSNLGGICTNEVDFEGSMKRFFREILPDVATDYFQGEGCRRFVEQHLGAASKHRSIREKRPYIVDDNSEDVGLNYRETRGGLSSFLSEVDLASAIADHSLSYKRVQMGQTNSFDGLMNHLENLGHAPAPHVDGLTVELLPFQQQTLQWATERELTPGGLQAFISPKLPSVEEPNAEIYYNPIIGKCMTTKPNLVRGGIIGKSSAGDSRLLSVY
jgi:hypothetical protein